MSRSRALRETGREKVSVTASQILPFLSGGKIQIKSISLTGVDTYQGRFRSGNRLGNIMEFKVRHGLG